MLYLYVVLAAPPPTKPLPIGIAGARPFFVEAAGLACAASETTIASVAPEPANVLRHQEVVEALMGPAAVLPLRFGTLVEDREACVRVLERQADAVKAVLERIDGCVEFALRIAGYNEAPPALTEIRGEGRGAAYIKSLASRQLGWPTSSDTFPHDRLAAHAVDRFLWPRSAAQPDLRASFLVRRADAAAFLTDVAAFRQIRPDLSLSCTGPWPPYSFSDPNLWGAPL